MVIVSLTSIGNEEGIIESFVRYHSHFVDKMYFISSCCIDNTLKILKNLKEEGFSVEVFIEPDILFEQKVLENKYLRKVAEKGDSDLILPLDADEFLCGNNNPREILDELSLDRVYTVTWKNYAFTEDIDMNEMFIPKRLKYVKKNHIGNNIPKVIIPTKLIKNKHLIVSTGHHEVLGVYVKNQQLETIYLAHYPVIGKEQYLLKMYGNSIKLITWTSRGNSEASHITKQIALIEKGDDLYKIANGYGLDDIEDIEFEPLNLEYCDENNLIIKYKDLISTNAFQGVCAIGQLMAIKAYNMEMDKLESDKPRILIYGTGIGAKTMFDSLPENLVNIRAYIESDELHKFRMHDRRLVISPKEIKFFRYDAIVISSGKYYEEMKKNLIENYVEPGKIKGVDYLVDLCM